MIYAWHEPAWAQLRAARAKQHHALLLNGPIGTGKRRFANTFAQAMLCGSATESGFACNECADCHWFNQGTHPDFRLLTPDALRLEAEAASEGSTEEGARGEKKAAVQITIDQVRELQNFVSLTTHRNGGKRVVLIHPAEAMNVFAANALLKMLEEPSVGTMFLLITDDIRRLLPTIISRCRRFPLPGVGSAEALAWLEQQGIKDAEVLLAQAGGAPLTALALAETGEADERRRFLDQLARLGTPDTALELAAQSQKTALATVVRWLSTWCYDLMAMRMAGTIRYHLDYREAIKSLAQRLSVDQLLIYQDLLKASARSYTHPLNPRLFLEQLLLSYCQTIAASLTSEHA